MEDQNDTQIDLAKVVKAIFRKLPVIGAITVIFALAAYAYCLWFMPPVYSTHVSFNVTNYQGYSESMKVQSSDVTTSNILVYSYAAMMKTDRVLDEVAKNTGLGYSAAQLSSMISASGMMDETQLLEVTVRCNRPDHAQTIANVVADVAPAVIQEVIKGSSAEVIDYPKLPSRPISPNPIRIALIGALIGLVLSVAGVLLAEKFDLRIKSAEGLAADFDRPVLGTVSGSEGYTELKNNIRFSFTERGCRRVAVTDTGDGAGKERVAAGLAAALAGDGKRVLLIDADPGRAGIDGIFGLNPLPGLSNVLVGDAELGEALRKDVRPGLDAICAGSVPPSPVELLGCREMRALTDGLADGYDYIILSAPAAVGEAEGWLLRELSHGVVSVVRARSTGTDKIKAAADILSAAQARLIGFVYNTDKKNAREAQIK